MDRVARERIVNVGIGKGFFALCHLALFLAAAGCHFGARGTAPPPPAPGEVASDQSADGHGWPSAEEGRDASRVSGSSAPVAVAEWIQPAIPLVEPGEDNAAGPPREPAPAGVTEDAREAADNAARSVTSHPAETTPGTTGPGDATASAPKPKAATSPHPIRPGVSKETRGTSPPRWARDPEELVYRVDFIGITMGYARFRYQGKVSIGGRTAYHLNVRAWTSGVLSFIYPINDTIEYYLDVETLAPIRQEYTQRQRGMPDVAIYDQETGTITYRYLQTGKIRKQVSTVPMVYDPVSVAYYFRWRDLGLEDRPRNVYGGRKVYQISARVLGNERIRTERGEVDTIAVQPLIRRDGKPDNKGDLKIWFSGDERRVPVRLYAKFRKIKDWTLVGELMPKAGG